MDGTENTLRTISGAKLFTYAVSVAVILFFITRIIVSTSALYGVNTAFTA